MNCAARSAANAATDVREEIEVFKQPIHTAVRKHTPLQLHAGPRNFQENFTHTHFTLRPVCF